MKILADKLTKNVVLPDGSTLNILQDISLTIEPSELLGILGISGSGKSTLLGLLAGLDVPSKGRLFWDDKEITAMNEDERAKLRLMKAGFIFQNFELLQSYTAIENVLLPLELQTKSKIKLNEEFAGAPINNNLQWAEHCLAEVGLKARLYHYPNQLSGGEQQRVAIARAFAIKPNILFADEPTGNLDQKTGARIIQLILDLNKKYHTTTICVTHDPALSEICSQTLYLADGQLHAS